MLVTPVPQCLQRQAHCWPDNGLGVDPQYFDRIFGMFQRLHQRDDFAGTGIWLAVCKKIVERHGGTYLGRIGGRGSTFSFVLESVGTS